MLMKLALRNVRRSVRDYAVYFVTLTLGVAVFYAFNAIGDSRVLFEARKAPRMCSWRPVRAFSISLCWS